MPPTTLRPALLVGGGAIVLLALLHGALFWPGIMTWDAIRQYGQALSGQYDDWHPPAMNWLWRQLGAFGAGPAPMLVVQLALYWGGTALWMQTAWMRGRRVATGWIALLALSPIVLVLVGTVLKDSLFAGALLLASGLLATRSGSRAARIFAALLLVAAATLRFNAAPACLPLLLLAAPAVWRRGWRLGATVMLAGIPLLLALPLANAVLQAKRSGVELSLVIYDLGGIGAFSATDAFPPTGVANPVAVNRDCYSPISWDRYAWWGAAPCAIGFTNLAAPLKAGHGPYGRWAAAVAAHPLAYAAHRLAHFDRNTRFLVHDADLPGLSPQSDPNPWGFAVAPNGARAALQRAADTLLTTPPGWPIFWLALGLGVLVLRPTFGDGDPAVALAWSAVLYGFSYLPLSVASEVRYHFWTMSAVGIAAALLLTQRTTWRVPRWRLAIALAPVLVVTVAGLVARL